jgi:hypothetical protein
MAYFSHSYRFEDNRLNLYFWEMLSHHGLYFVVDPPSTDRRPMDVTYLEWLMSQSAAFIAVIPRRENAPVRSCSPYQIFEYRLAVRARKPRLVFLQDDLDAQLLGIETSEVVTFRRRDVRAEVFRKEDEEQAGAFATRVRQSADPRAQGAKPIGLVTRSRDPAYADLVPRLRDEIQTKLYRSCQLIDPDEFNSDYRLFQALENCEVLVSEIRPPYVPADVYGLIHGGAIPTLRIAHLAPDESPKDASTAMRLASKPLQVPAKLSPALPRNWPIVLSGYQVDLSMQPVLFWNNDPEDLCRRIIQSLGQIDANRTVLDSSRKARQYLLRLGRLHGKVFISNFNAQNDLAVKIATALRDNETLDVFQYTDEDRDPNRSNWKDEVRGEIELCTHFVALIDEGFHTSSWCLWEMDVAVDLYRQGQLELFAYKLGTDQIPDELRSIRKPVLEINSLSTEDKVSKVVSRIVKSFEDGKRVGLGDAERSKLIEILADRLGLWTLERLVAELRESGLPEAITERARAAAADSPALLDWGRLIDVLAEQPIWIQPWKSALGKFLTSVTREANIGDREAIWNLVRLRSLMPDIRHRIGRRTLRRELGLGLSYSNSSGTVGTFSKIHDGRLESWQPAMERTGGAPLPGLVDLVSGQVDWQGWVAKIGKTVAAGPPFLKFQENYLQAVSLEAEGLGLLGVCVASDASGLGVPIEWATFDGVKSPLALKHPVRRYLLGAQTPRPSLRWLLKEGKATPLRVLIVGSHAGDLPEVDAEIKAVREIYRRWFEGMGWPMSDLVMIEPREATTAKLEYAIQNGNYHMLHFAGHGGQGGSEPGLVVIDSKAKGKTVELPASLLAEWVARSELRMVYLSSCQGAAAIPEKNVVIHRFESLAEALVSAGVSEVVGFRWPILDADSRSFALKFHESYVHEFDAAVALWNARKSFPMNAQIWAAGMAIAQCDSPEG